MENFKTNNYQIITEYKTKVSAPSNIALIKYWGKKQKQIPANPSLSFTLKEAKTQTSIHFVASESKNKEVNFEFYFEGKRKESFEPKLATFFRMIQDYCPYLLEVNIRIESQNTFPHSSGIASSASAMAAMASGIIQYEKQIVNAKQSEDYYEKKASFLARLGSGSACRSIKGNVVVWGENKTFEQASNLYGICFPKEIHEVFHNYQDTIVLVDKGSKKVSSSMGHQLMNNHPYAAARFVQAHDNLAKLSEVLQNGDLDKFIEIVESEALTLHAMMQTSIPYFILMKPNTLQVIEKIWTFREETKIPVCFTLDAGANVHVLYPQKYKESVHDFIEKELKPFAENHQVLHDEMGMGAFIEE